MYKKILVWLSQKLYPNGFAFRLPEALYNPDAYVTEDGTQEYTNEAGETYVAEYSPVATGGVFHRLHEAIADVQSQTHKDALSILDSIVADNANFTIEDANAWYIRLGIYNSGTVPLADMMLAINQRLNYPGDVVYGRSHYSFIRDQIRAAGFRCILVENNFGGVTKTPSQIIGFPVQEAALNGFELGEAELGDSLMAHDITIVANYLEEDKDADFVISPDYRSTFYIFGELGYGTWANIPADRKTEFRQLILLLKPAQTVGILFVHYV